MERPGNIYSAYAFTGNPIIIEDPEPAPEGKVTEYGVAIDGREVYRGRYLAPMAVNVADICAPYVEFFPAVICSDAAPAKGVAEDADLPRLTVDVENGEMTYGCTLLPGGVSKEVFRTLAGRKTDIFRERLLNYRRNFFLTLRGSSKILNIPEAETIPVYFLLDDEREIYIDHDLGDNHFSVQPPAGVHAIDFGRLRRWFAKEFNVLPAVFHLYVDREPSITVVIERSAPAREEYFLEYRNSLGVIDRLRICGMLTEKVGDDEEESVTESYDPLLDAYCSIRPKRVDSRSEFGITMVIENQERLALLRDMLASTEVWLEGYGRKVRVAPEAKDLEWRGRFTAPIEVSLTLAAVETESLFSPVHFGEETSSDGVFTDEFTEEFE